MDVRKMEKRLNLRAIMANLMFNVLAAAGVFAATYLILHSISAAVFYTFVSWSLTLSLSAGYWIWYLFRRIRGGMTLKKNIACFLVIMVFSALVMIWWALQVIGM
jgi:hypothetical protein